MAVDLKALILDTTIIDGNTVLFGADSQAAPLPSVYALDTIISFLSNSYFVANSALFLSSNGVSTNSTTLLLGNSTVNTIINSSSITVTSIIANGSLGTAGHVLHSNGTSLYWSTDDQGVTSVATGNGLVGGTITTTGTVSIRANNGVIANSTGLFVRPGTGIVVNATGTHVNSAYIGTLTANNSDNLGGVAAASYIQNTDSRTLSGNLTFSGNTTNFNGSVIFNENARFNLGVIANGSLGTAGHVLHSNGTSIYWAVDDQGVTSIVSGNGLNSGTITTTGTISVRANNGLIANATGLYVGAGSGISVNSTAVAVLANNGLVSNATGIHVIGGETMTVNSSGVHVNNSVLLKVFNVANSQLFP